MAPAQRLRGWIGRSASSRGMRPSTEPFSPPPWTLDSPLIRVQDRGRFRHSCLACVCQLQKRRLPQKPSRRGVVARRPAGGGGRARLNSEAITEAVRPCTPPGEFGARHWPTRLTSARHRIRHGIRHTAACAGRRPRPRLEGGRLPAAGPAARRTAGAPDGPPGGAAWHRASLRRGEGRRLRERLAPILPSALPGAPCVPHTPRA